MASNEQSTEGIKAFISNKVISGNLPPEEAEAALELLGTLDPDNTAVDDVHPELEPVSEFEPVTMSPSWIRTHR
ncbi:hypothetical protein [Arthrobacter caoxuetaonis]|uniref:Uncharacterized protein n=1 Tax=Arthrobacter caoxuetaonis TaxID=2886935 RepID=A0A9X1SDK6_9MICC|nr:hypothetical protein [Arthrobacter caoxuetaonis]MCC3299755.1 hypothetical protein [Arthrobacter caoxuetaonis]USQ59343.1 hypothetical protein NF551_17320 [Arthrobacter caoxuetaonis]